MYNFAQDGHLKSAKYNGLTLKDNLLDAGSGGKLEVLIGFDGGDVSGTITDAQGSPAAGASVLLRASSHPHCDCTRGSAADTNGHFEIHGVAPSEYEAIAYPAGQAPETDEIAGAKLTVVANGRASLNLKIATPLNH
jgi:hypothetical protein